MPIATVLTSTLVIALVPINWEKLIHFSRRKNSTIWQRNWYVRKRGCRTSWKFSELIFAVIFHSKIRKVNSSKKIFLPFVEELLDLESKCINIEVEGENETFYFVLTLFFWGFAANYPCRICKINKKDFLIYLFEESKFIKYRN